MIKLFAVDMDGTCLDSRSRISDETLFWLKRAKEHGVEIVPTTGRALSCLPHQLKGQDLFRYVITSNGAMVTDLKEKKTLFQALIPLPAALSLIRDCQGPGVGLTAHIRHRYLLEGRVLTLLGHLTYGQDAGEARAVRSLLHYTEAKKRDVEELQFFFFSEKSHILTAFLPALRGLFFMSKPELPPPVEGATPSFTFYASCANPAGSRFLYLPVSTRSSR